MGINAEEHALAAGNTKNVLSADRWPGRYYWHPNRGSVRALIQLKNVHLRDRTTGIVKNAPAQVRLNTDEFNAGDREKAVQPKQSTGQDKLGAQLDRASAGGLDAGKTAVKAA